MDPVILIVVPGALGGLLLAFLFLKLQHRERDRRAAPDVFSREPLSTDVINMSRIRVAGIGGLGLVAMALWVAWFVPRIGQTLAVGLVFGCLLALALILVRRRQGAMPSSGRRAGANTTLAIETPEPVDAGDAGKPAEGHASHPRLDSLDSPVPLR